ncbi:MAG: hypothetical protein HY912_20010 [Desulfomonile tiedjei]|uniref:Uncharacterized protein n=1 Tax=Desulfomonile tiedjei TaxID=2358 RepID=A0A9D6V6I8_9BACT|nr:hypothetical protein [Desulfomonile tiedjei]
MTESIPISVVKGWITDLQSALKQESQESKTQPDFWIDKGVRHGLDQIGHRVTTWLRHQDNRETLLQSGKRFLVTKDVNLSSGRYRKLEWYEGDEFIVLAWRHAKDAEEGELMMEIQKVRDLSKTYLVYTGSSSYEDLVGLAREAGMESIRDEGNLSEWAEKVWA